MIRLSIIIPFYNVEQYIAQCLDSVYSQDIPEEEYEVICVNDASPDNSREIVKEYQKKHSNLILVEHEVNKKLGAARNTGRSVARGKYIWNVDSDDMIAPNCLHEILEKCEANNLDVLMFRNSILKEDSISKPSQAIWNPDEPIEDGFSFWKSQGVKNKAFISAVWVMVIRREFLDENHIYSPAINMNEDVPYTYQCLTLSRRIIASNNVYYITRVNPSSLTSEFNKNISLERLYEDMCVSAIDLYALYKCIPKNEKAVKKVIQEVVTYEFITDVNLLKRSGKEQTNQYAKLLRSNILHIVFLFSIFPRKQKWQLVKLIFA